MLNLADVTALDVSPDGSIVIGGSEYVVIAFHTMMPDDVWESSILTLRIHASVVVVPVHGQEDAKVLDLMTGRLIQTLTLSGIDVRCIFVFEGLASGLNVFAGFLTSLFSVPLLKLALKADDHVPGSGEFMILCSS